MKSLLLLGLCWLTSIGAHAAESAAVAAVLRADQARLTAMMAGDGKTLSNILSDDLRMVHSDGRVESKADYVKNLLAGDTAYTDAKTSQIETVEPTPDTVVVLGMQEMKKKLGPTWSDIKLRYMAVYRNERGTWRMVAWQSARPAGTSVVPPK